MEAKGIELLPANKNQGCIFIKLERACMLSLKVNRKRISCVNKGLRIFYMII